MAGGLEELVRRLEAAVQKLECLDGAPSAGSGPRSISESAATASAQGSAPSVVAFDNLLASPLARLVKAGAVLGGHVQDATKVLEDAFKAERTVVLAISQCKAPSVENLQALVKPVADCMMQGNKLTEGRRTDAFNHVKAVAESLQALTWVIYTGKECGLSLPAPHVEEMWQAAEFYTNKVLMEYRNKDDKHVEWAKALKELYLPSLKDYVKQHHTTGPAWNPKGIDVAAFKPGGTPSAAPQKKAPPPPPPGPPPPPPPPAGAISQPKPGAAASASPVGMNAVFKELSKGEGVTAGLRKVTDDMKTKNRAERSGVVPLDAAPAAAAAAPSPKAAASKAGPAKFELQQGRKWVIENQVDKKDLVIDDCNARQSVYIFGCKNVLVQVKGKVNNITVDNSSRAAVVFEDVVAAFEVVNSKSVEVQCSGVVPTVALDKVDGCQLYLSKDSLYAAITTAKCSEINVLIPGKTAEEDMVEHPLPEQFVSTFKDGQWVTTAVSHSGG